MPSLNILQKDYNSKNLDGGGGTLRIITEVMF